MTVQLMTPADAGFPIRFLTLEEGAGEDSSFAWSPPTCCDYSPVALDPLPPLSEPHKISPRKASRLTRPISWD